MRTVLVLVSVLVALLAAACGGDDGGDGGSNNGATGKFVTPCAAPEAGKANILGFVKNTWGSVLSAPASVRFGAEVGDLDGYGRFYICNVAANQQHIITVDLPREYLWAAFNGYAPVTRRVTLKAGEERVLRFRMKDSQFQTMDAAAVAAGGNVSDGKATVTFPAAAFVKANGSAYTGAVNIQLATFDSGNPDDLESFPGDFAGEDNGTEVGLYSQGFVNVQLFDDEENPLELAEGKAATLTFPVTNLDPSDTTIPMWYFDEVKGTWVREGEGTVDHGSGTITAQVAHFSFWNADKPVTLTDCVTGVVQDQDGVPLPDALVYGTGQANAQSDAEGKFCINFYPRASFQIRGNYFDAGVIYEAVQPYSAWTGSRDGGQTCTNPASCEALPAPVVFQGTATDTNCVKITLNGATSTHKSGTLVINNTENGAAFFSAKMNGSSSTCVELPVGASVNAYLNVYAEGKEAWCGVSSFNGTDLSAGGPIVVGDAQASCGDSGCDELVMKCEEFSGHPM